MRTRSVAVLTLAVALAGAGSPPPAAAGTPVPVADRTTPAAGPIASPIDRLLSGMTLPQKVGQLFTVYAYGADADAPAAADAATNRRLYGVDTPAQVVSKYHLGGVIYFAWTNSLQNPRQVTALSNGLQAAAGGVPLMISTDQESGVVSRLPAPATQFPGNMALGAGRNVLDAFTAAQITGRELRAVGIGQAWAPVADVNVNAANPVIGVRSFSSDPILTAGLTASQVLGLQLGANTSAAAKHFPGHGDTNVDSHTGLPVINHTRAEWNRVDAPPFRAAVTAGVDAIMTAHIVVPALDPSGDPATLSRPIVTGLLRGELGYRGVVVTDSLAMEGVRQKYGDDRVPVLALKAGVDQLLMPPNLDVAYNAVLTAVADGELTEARIDESVRRILTLKQKRGRLSWTPLDPGAAERTVGQPAHQRAAQGVTDRTVTAIRNDAGLLPYPGTGKSVLVTGWNSSVYNNVPALAGSLAARGASASALVTNLPTDAQITAAVTAAGTTDLTVVLTSRAWDTTTADPGGRQQALIRALVATGRPVVVVAVRDPYDIAHLPGVTTYLSTYSFTAVAMESLAKVLLGVTAPHGRLPVPIPVAGDPGTELYPFGHGLSWRTS
ncbi:glycoside hydrolase family 3 protein [Virgisporangium aurantiacum]|uniref:beta-N-acetylhexosaminidase n=1 Tax=Virgisporangium aurantiacum TaxID=175570 RepID=A0A8J3Z5T4_9ACTN|nr:glycoside hydrolase family 3 protein [Virgisporangium aurantiacum]GIJ55445.1 beta-N-acetylhexosaminidase [Virgisporangium aurantiacum]